MKIDIQIPKPGSGALYTVVPSLSADDIAVRSPERYAPNALRYDDCLLIDDENDIAILDPRCDYETLEIDEAMKKYTSILSDENASKRDRSTAHYILGIIVQELWVDDRMVRDEIRKLLKDHSSFQ